MASAKALPDALALIELPEKIRELERSLTHQQTLLYNPRTKSKVTPAELERMHNQLKEDQHKLDGLRKQLAYLTQPPSAAKLRPSGPGQQSQPRPSGRGPQSRS